jgi:NAD(P)-dependent dehydrogenase (short-subunit alcohol dehydrogenase family)
VEKLGGKCLLLPGDLRDPATAKSAVTDTVKMYGQLDVVVNNAAVQPYTKDIMDVSDEQLDNTFRTNVYPLFYMTKAALPYLKCGSSVAALSLVQRPELLMKGHRQLLTIQLLKALLFLLPERWLCLLQKKVFV